MAFSASDLQTVVPAATPAWIRVIATSNTTTDDGATVKEWQDEVLQVLAYAVLPGGRGAYMVALDPDGPSWASPPPDLDGHVELSVGVIPQRGKPCEFTEGFTYCSIPLDDFCGTLEWVI